MKRRDIILGVGGTLVTSAAGLGGLAYKGALINQPMAQALPTSDGAALAPTPHCLDADDDPTPFFAEGPYYAPHTPLKTDFLEPDHTGTTLTLTGQVFDTECRPMPGAVIDFWHVDQNAVYDNSGYRYRGHQITDSEGRYGLTTLHPQPYDLMGIWRTAHLHVKLQAQDTDLLTSQLYFPRYGEENARDSGYMPALEVVVLGTPSDARIDAKYDFILVRKVAA